MSAQQRLVEFVRKKDKRVEQYKKVLEERAQLAQQKAKEKKEADRLRRQEYMSCFKLLNLETYKIFSSKGK